jgi:flagellar motility protein MotE (MotC chaperone)
MSKILSILRSPWLAVGLGMVLFFATSTLLVSMKVSPLPPPGEVHARAPAQINGPSWDFFNPELDQLVEELQQERQTNAARAKELDELSTRLQAERAELENAARAIRKLQSEFDRDMTKLKEDETANLKKLAKMYAVMEPASAASIMRELDDGVLVKIMLLMKEDQTALVLDAMVKLGREETKRAARLSEILRLAVPAKSPAPKS